MKKQQKIIIIVLIASILIALVNISNATDNAKIVLSSDKTQISSGDKVVVTVKITDITGVSEGIIGLSGTLSYDNTKFENVTIEALNNWDKPEYNSENGKLLTLKGDYLKTDEAVFTITLTAKSNVELGETEIKLKDVKVSDIDNEYDLTESSAKITVVEKKQEQPDNTNNNTSGNENTNNNTNGNENTNSNTNGNENTNSNTNGNENTNSNINGNQNTNSNSNGNTNVVQNVTTKNTVATNKINSTTSSGKLPNTGIGISALLLGGITLLVIGIVCLIKCNKYKGI